MELPTEFKHHQSAHCESGVTSNLLIDAGYSISEALSFGIGSGLFFVHLPFVKVMGLPLTSYRTFPGTIFKKTCKRLGVPFEYHTYRNQIEGTKQLEKYLDNHQTVGLRANIFWLPYIPEGFRFQFNAHNLIVYGRNSESEFKISDPIMEEKTTCNSHALLRARYSKGPLAPQGLLFFPTKNKQKEIPHEVLKKAVHKGIRETVYGMLFSPLPFAGTRGIRFLSKRVAKWPQKIEDPDALKLYLSNIVRMQEEIGTGGAGFRLLYAAFLQESGERFGQKDLIQASKDFCEVANLWREFATLTVQFCKDRLVGNYEQIPQTLLKIADRETQIYKNLRRHYL